MATLTVGRICMKIAGREAGKNCVVLANPKDNFVEVTGPKILTGVKRRRCNIDHLEPTEHQIKIQEGATDQAVIQTMDKEGLIKKLNLKKPSPEIIKGPKTEEKFKKEVKQEKKPEKKAEKKDDKKPKKKEKPGKKAEKK